MGKFNIENLCDNDYAHIDLNTILMFTADQATNYDPESMIRKPLIFSNASALKHKLIKLDQDEAVKLLNDLIQECVAQRINLKCTVSSNDFIVWSHHVAEKINNLSS